MTRNYQTLNARHKALQWQRRHDIPTVRLTLRTRLWVRAYEWLTK